jgi:hypothetical protein
MNDQRAMLAKELEAVLSGGVDLGSLLKDPSMFREPMEHCFHGLHHFLADADIRAREPAYASMQISEMRKLISLLRSGASSQQLESVHFLGPSE